MSKNLVILLFMRYSFFLLALFVAPLLASAHTSDQRYQDGYIVDLSTAPVSPWVGEKMGMSFVFRDPTSGVSTSSVVSAEWSIDALTRENNKIQETIFVSPKLEVVNGGFVTDFTFTEVGTYDLHLLFMDTEGQTHSTGFRKQVRNGEVGTAVPPKTKYAYLSIALIMGILGFVLGKSKWKN